MGNTVLLREPVLSVPVTITHRLFDSFYIRSRVYTLTLYGGAPLHTKSMYRRVPGARRSAAIGVNVAERRASIQAARLCMEARRSAAFGVNDAERRASIQSQCIDAFRRARRSVAFGVNVALGLGETFVCVLFTSPYFCFMLKKKTFKKKIGIEESVLSFWDSVLFGHLRDSSVTFGIRSF